MNSMDYQTAPYRRGLTLGLTMAEIFMLLLFLLLMLLAAISIEWTNTRTKAVNELHSISGTTQEIRNMIINGETELTSPHPPVERPRHPLPNTIAHLKSDVDELHNTVHETVQENRGNRTSLEVALNDLHEENRQLTAENRDLQQNIETLQEETLSASDLENKNQELVAENRDLQQNLEALQKGALSTSDMEKENRTLQQEIRKLNKKLASDEALRRDIFISNKGIDPPCWYEVTTRPGRGREKTHFLLEIAVHDKFLRVRPSCPMPPPGRAENELEPERSAATSYADEYAQLPFAPFLTERKFTLAEFTDNATPIKEMGRNNQVRNYECVFHALVWDRTAETAKDRWKQAIEEIEKSVYTTHVKNDPWESQECR